MASSFTQPLPLRPSRCSPSKLCCQVGQFNHSQSRQVVYDLRGQGSAPPCPLPCCLHSLLKLSWQGLMSHHDRTAVPKHNKKPAKPREGGGCTLRCHTYNPSSAATCSCGRTTKADYQRCQGRFLLQYEQCPYRLILSTPLHLTIHV